MVLPLDMESIKADRLKAAYSIGVTAMFPNMENWFPREHRPGMEDLAQRDANSRCCPGCIGSC